MKICPECGTQYEDHVPTCIADGAELVGAAPAPRAAAPPPPPPPAIAPPPPSRMPVLAAVLALFFTTSAVALVIGGVVLSATLTGSATVAPSQPLPTPHPAPRLDEPKEQPPIDVMVVSEPMGAGVYENDQFVCQTPCTVQHPAHAPLPRTFVFKLPGYHDKSFEMTDASQPISVQLVHQHAAAAPQPAGPRPSIGRER